MSTLKILPITSYFEAFSQAASKIVGEVLEEEAEWGPPVVEVGNSFFLDGINVQVGLVGDVGGHVNFGFDAATARAIAERMIGEDVPVLDELAMSALCELANMITGHARSHLVELGVRSDLTPPTLTVGRGITTSWHKVRALTVSMKIGSGTVILTLGLTRQS